MFWKFYKANNIYIIFYQAHPYWDINWKISCETISISFVASLYFKIQQFVSINYHIWRNMKELNEMFTCLLHNKWREILWIFANSFSFINELSIWRFTLLWQIFLSFMLHNPIWSFKKPINNWNLNLHTNSAFNCACICIVTQISQNFPDDHQRKPIEKNACIRKVYLVWGQN